MKLFTITAKHFNFVAYVLSESGFVKFPQIGKVVIQDNVEIGANTTIDRGTIGSTLIKNGVKLDNQIQIAHNVEIGENTVMQGRLVYQVVLKLVTVLCLAGKLE